MRVRCSASTAPSSRSARARSTGSGDCWRATGWSPIGSTNGCPPGWRGRDCGTDRGFPRAFVSASYASSSAGSSRRPRCARSSRSGAIARRIGPIPASTKCDGSTRSRGSVSARPGPTAWSSSPGGRSTTARRWARSQGSPRRPIKAVSPNTSSASVGPVTAGCEGSRSTSRRHPRHRASSPPSPSSSPAAPCCRPA